MAASFIKTLGHADRVADDEAEYVRVAVTLARDREPLRLGPARLREQMAASPLCDIKAYVPHF